MTTTYKVEISGEFVGLPCVGGADLMVNGQQIRLPDALLELVKPPLPPEPPLNSFVHLASYYGVYERADHGWIAASEAGARALEWEALVRLNSGDTPVLLVPAPEPVTLPWTAECATGLGNEIRLDQADDDGHIPVMLRGVGTVYLGADDARAGGYALLTAADEADRRVSDVQ